MSIFEFLMVLVSIIIGLGVTEILTGVARSLRSRATVKFYWVHMVVVVFIFVALLQQWWEIWGLRSVTEWSFLALIFMLTAPVCLFLISHLLFPDPINEADIESYYYKEMRPIWILGAIAVLVSTVFRPIFFEESLFSLDNATSLVGFLGVGILFISKHRVVHAIFVCVLLILILLDVLQWNPVIEV
jgi:hypothetical protein